eukprot:4566024-Amphidinium_carterae.1
MNLPTSKNLKTFIYFQHQHVQLLAMYWDLNKQSKFQTPTMQNKFITRHTQNASRSSKASHAMNPTVFCMLQTSTVECRKPAHTSARGGDDLSRTPNCSPEQ